MPQYEYQCEKCLHCFNELLKMDDRTRPTREPCPNCKEEKCVTQLMSAPAVVSPFSIDGLKRPKSDFREKMAQIKESNKHTAKIKDY